MDFAESQLGNRKPIYYTTLPTIPLAVGNGDNQVRLRETDDFRRACVALVSQTQQGPNWADVLNTIRITTTEVRRTNPLVRQPEVGRRDERILPTALPVCTDGSEEDW